jgi:general secretion pathway protein N
LRAAALGAAAFIVFLVVTTPADWLVRQFADQAPQLRLSGITGSLWSGSVAQARYDDVSLNDVQWQWRPLALFAGRLEYGLSGSWEEHPVRFAAGKNLLGTPYLKDVELAAPLPKLTGALRLPVELSGDLDLALDRVTFTGAGPVPALEGRGQWTPAVITAPIELDLGKVVVEMSLDGNSTAAQVSARDGRLLVDGTLGLDPSGEYRLDADLTPVGELSEDLKAGLNAVAEYRNGRYRLEWSGGLN